MSSKTSEILVLRSKCAVDNLLFGKVIILLAVLDSLSSFNSSYDSEGITCCAILTLTLDLSRGSWGDVFPAKLLG